MLNWKKVIAVSLALCAMAIINIAQAAPKKIAMTYDLKRNGTLFAHVTEDFSQDGKRYSIKSVTKGIGIYALLGERTLTSTGYVTKQGLKPMHFESLQSKKASKALINDFDWKNHILHMQVKGIKKQEKLENNTQDLLSVMYQFMFNPPQGDVVNLPVTIGKKLRVQEYAVNRSAVVLETDAGKFKTIALIDGDKDDEKRIYLATDHQYIPVKIEMRDEDAKLEQVLIKVKFE
jgi:hypothetical protein